MKLVKTKIQPHKLALRRETIAVLASHRLARVAGGQHHAGLLDENDPLPWPTETRTDRNRFC